eukprot:22710-Eustigmatos_ZCMA.PRE.1
MTWSVVTIFLRWIGISPLIKALFTGFASLYDEVATEATKAYIESRTAELPASLHRVLMSSAVLQTIANGASALMAIGCLLLVIRTFTLLDEAVRLLDNA